MKFKALSIILIFAVALACSSCSSDSKSNSNSDNSGSTQQLIDNQSRAKKSNEFFAKLLDSFLKNHFSKRWKGRTYTPESLIVVKCKPSDTKTYDIIGTFRFKDIGGIKEYPDEEFRATVQDDGDGKYHISFSRKREIFFGAKKGGWETIPSKPFEYTTDPY